jgi:hypothetical protein
MKDYNDMLIYLFRLIHRCKFFIFGFIACSSKFCCLFAVQTLSALSFDFSDIAPSIGRQKVSLH